MLGLCQGYVHKRIYFRGHVYGVWGLCEGVGFGGFWGSGVAGGRHITGWVWRSGRDHDRSAGVYACGFHHDRWTQKRRPSFWPCFSTPPRWRRELLTGHTVLTMAARSYRDDRPGVCRALARWQRMHTARGAGPTAGPREPSWSSLAEQLSHGRPGNRADALPKETTMIRGWVLVCAAMCAQEWAECLGCVVVRQSSPSCDPQCHPYHPRMHGRHQGGGGVESRKRGQRARTSLRQVMGLGCHSHPAHIRWPIFAFFRSIVRSRAPVLLPTPKVYR